MSTELSFTELHRCCDPASLGFETTAEVEPLSGALGQEEAMRALAFGVSVASKGYNIFALGRAGSGRRTFIKRELELRAENEPTPSSWCYGFNFKEPRHPVAMELPAGKGDLLRARLDALIAELQRAIPQALEADDVTNRRAAIYEDRGREAKAAMANFPEGRRRRPQRRPDRESRRGRGRSGSGGGGHHKRGLRRPPGGNQERHRRNGPGRQQGSVPDPTPHARTPARSLGSRGRPAPTGDSERRRTSVLHSERVLQRKPQGPYAPR